MKHSHVLRVHDCETRTILLPMMYDSLLPCQQVGISGDTSYQQRERCICAVTSPTSWTFSVAYLPTVWWLWEVGFVEQEDSFFTFTWRSARSSPSSGTTVHAHKSLSKLWRVEKMSDVTMTRPTLNKIEQIRSQRSCASWGRVHLKVPNYRRVVFSESACKSQKARSKASVDIHSEFLGALSPDDGTWVPSSKAR